MHEFNIKNGFITSGQSYVYNNLIVTGLTLSSVPSNDDTLTQILARDGSGVVKYRTASSLGGGSSTFTGGTVSGNTYFTSGLTANTLTVTGDVTINQNLTVSSNLRAATVSATTYYNLPTQVAGSQYQVQYNNGTTFGADDKFTWDYSVYSLRIGSGHSLTNPNESSLVVGSSNTINNSPNSPNFRYNAIFGGQQSTLEVTNPSSFESNIIVGGLLNNVRERYNTPNVTNNGIIGGSNNIIDDASNSVVLGGYGNNVINLAASTFENNSIIGGSYNVLENVNQSPVFNYNSILGGSGNDITEFANPATIQYNSIVGGDDNHVRDANNSSVFGGESNQIYGQNGVSLFNGTIVGGTSNSIYNTNPGVTVNNNVILGGYLNIIYETNNSETSKNIIGVGDTNRIRDGIQNSILGGTTNNIIQSNQSSIIGGQNNTITSTTGVIILGGNGINGVAPYTTYVDNLNINTTPTNDDSLTQILARDASGFVKYRNASSLGGGSSTFTGGTVTGATNFTGGLSANTISATTYFNLPIDIRVTGGTYSNGTATFTNNTGGTFSVTGLAIQGFTGITATNGLSASTTNNVTTIGFSGGAISVATNFTNGLTANTISATTYSNLPVTGLTQGSNITITPNGVGGFTIASTGGGGGSFTGGTVNGPTTFTSGVTANTIVYSVVTLSSGATISVNAVLGNEFKVTLGGNSVLGNPTGAVDGQYLRFAIRQDTTGNRNLTFDTKYRFGNEIGTPSVDLTANKTSYLGVRYNAADDKFDVISFVSGY